MTTWRQFAAFLQLGTCVVVVVFLLGLGMTLHAAEFADRVFMNGNIWTGDNAQPRAEALAVRRDRIVAVGTNAQIGALIRPDTAVLDLKGRFVAPGFNDAHWHLYSSPIDLSDALDLAAFQRKIVEYANSHTTTGWIWGFGWRYEIFPDRVPNKKYLDSIVSDRPVFVFERDGHQGLANSKALAIAGITRESPDPPNGRIERDDHGDPTGELDESAADAMYEHIPKPSNNERYEELRRLTREAASHGITSIQEVTPNNSSNNIATLEHALAAGDLNVRFYVAMAFAKDPSTGILASYKSLRDKYRGPVLKFGSVKGVVDGVVDAKTAAMFEPFVGGGTGIPMWTQEELNRTVALYDKEGFQVLLHAIGDKAIHMALDAFEYTEMTNGTSGHRHRIEHVEVPKLSDLPRFKELGVIASTQGIFPNPDKTTLENYAVLLGSERASHAMPFKRIDDAGAVQAFGSDSPVFTMIPLKGIYCAATRKTAEGTPEGGWYPENRISVEAALRHYTRDAAYASFDEALKGTLTPGKLADFIVLSEDILSGPVEKLLKAKVLLTVMGGRDTYRAEELH